VVTGAGRSNVVRVRLRPRRAAPKPKPKQAKPGKDTGAREFTV
jgi:hypothetical protein